MRQITFPPTYEGWRRAARRALAQHSLPQEICWEELSADQPPLALFDEAEDTSYLPSAGPRVPALFPELAQRIACHRDTQRWALLYRVLWRLTHGEPHLLEILVDPDIDRLMRMDKAVRHDVHKMRAFVRFRTAPCEGQTWHVAWFEPEHSIVELNAPFFVDRFASMNWSILTPDRCAHWDRGHLTFTEGILRSDAPTGDDVEKLWLTYYGNIFNPARIKTRAMTAEMPKKYWKNLPEASVIPTLLNEAPGRVKAMMENSAKKMITDPAPVPVAQDWPALRDAAKNCTSCPLYQHATQTVFGQGSPSAALVFVGEQPGDREDRVGEPFIGPAGQLLDRALMEAGIDRDQTYVTNAVKHFKWEPRGQRRLHKKPSAGEMAACRPWLEAELQLIHPKVLVCLGGTAAHSILGPSAKVLRDRGKFVASQFCEQTMVTIHPSSLLRTPDEKSRKQSYDLFVQELRSAGRLVDC